MLLSAPDQNFVPSKALAGPWRISAADGRIIFEGESADLSEIQLSDQQMLFMEASLVSEIATSSIIVSGAGSIHLLNLDSNPLDLRREIFRVSGERSVGLASGVAVQLSSQTHLGAFSIILEADEELTMTAAQADSRVILRDTLNVAGSEAAAL
jgi:hypothetical protein